ncbi:MAG: hypothetical protein IJ524_07885 [Bacteroidales bacterium]|nr:hypothetical protein [Bacteroidales bacterium]
MRTKAVTCALALLLAGSAMAQVDRNAFRERQQQMREQFVQQRNQARRQYADERRKAEEEYAAFRRKANEDYAAAMRQAWEKMTVSPAETRPSEPKPPQPPKAVPDRMPQSIPLPQSEVVLPPSPVAPVPMPPIPEPEPSAPALQLQFYGTACSMHAEPADLRFKLPSIDERTLSETWQKLSLEKYDGILHDCIAQRETLQLSDWGYLRLLGDASQRLLGDGSDEAVLLQMYLMAQSGYRVRIARVGGHLVLLVPFNCNVYNYSFTVIDGIRHYLLTQEKVQSLDVCNVKFPREQVANLLMGNLPDLKGTVRRRTLQAESFGTMKATVEVEQGLIDYLDDYPRFEWEDYARAGLSAGVKKSLYPVLRSQLEGKSARKAATMLLDFVQTAFEYQTDEEQFGYERPLFADESIFYPYNDCEDRSIFYSILVRDLLGLDVMLVHWPGHLATAVHFPEEVEGDYYTVDGQRYTICDPTYIGAGIGETMPMYQDVSAKLVKIGK